MSNDIRRHQSCQQYIVLRGGFELSTHDPGGVLIDQDYDILEKCFRAGLHLDRLETDDALATMRDIGEVPETSNPEVHLGVLSLWHLLLSALGRHEEADRIATAAVRWLEKHAADFLLANFRAVVAESAIRRHGAPAAREWLKRHIAGPDGPLYFCRFPQHFATARALLATESCAAAALFLERLRRLADDYRRPLDIIEANVLLCQALWRTGESRAAMEALDRAEGKARPFGFIRLFVQDIAALAPVLHLLAQKRGRSAASRDFITRLLSFAAGPLAASPDATPAVMPALGKRQIDILRLLEKGGATQRIADETGVSANTVKHHVRKVFTALGVNRWAEAVRVARALGVIGKGK